MSIKDALDHGVGSYVLVDGPEKRLIIDVYRDVDGFLDFVVYEVEAP